MKLEENVNNYITQTLSLQFNIFLSMIVVEPSFLV